METTTLQSPQPLFPLKNWVKTAREFSWSMDLSLSVPSGSSAITSARHGPFITPACVSRCQLRVGRLFTVYKLFAFMRSRNVIFIVRFVHSCLQFGHFDGDSVTCRKHVRLTFAEIR